MSFSSDSMRRALQAHTTHCSQLLDIATHEEQALRGQDSYRPGIFDAARKQKLTELNQSLETLKKHRIEWQLLPSPERARHPDICRWIRTAQEVGMKLIILERENEQTLLRRGFLPQSQGGTSPTAPAGNYLSGLYRRSAP